MSPFQFVHEPCTIVQNQKEKTHKKISVKIRCCIRCCVEWMMGILFQFYVHKKYFFVSHNFVSHFIWIRYALTCLNRTPILCEHWALLWSHWDGLLLLFSKIRRNPKCFVCKMNYILHTIPKTALTANVMRM